MGHRLFASYRNSRLKLLHVDICSLPDSPPLRSRRPRLSHCYAYLLFLGYILFPEVSHSIVSRMFRMCTDVVKLETQVDLTLEEGCHDYRLELQSFGYVPLGIITLVFFATIPWLNFIVSSVLATALAKETSSPFNVITATSAFGSIPVSM